MFDQKLEFRSTIKALDGTDEEVVYTRHYPDGPTADEVYDFLAECMGYAGFADKTVDEYFYNV